VSDGPSAPGDAGLVIGHRPGELTAGLELAAMPSAPFWARRHTRATLRSWRVWPETIDTAELLVSELVTNAVKFSGPGPACLTLILRYGAGQLRIEVADPGPGSPVAAAADPDAESGRGLLLIEALSREWGSGPRDSGGKVVYCVLGAG
jgi:serine/threonine-protein kinase RsbW